MLGLMQDRPLLISSLIEHANAFHPDAEIVSRTVEGPIHRCTYGDIARRAKQMAKALVALGVAPGDRIATLAWNGYRHMELYYGVSGMGAVLHTINPRLFPEQITYIANHAEDQYLFFDLTFAPLIEKLGPLMKSVKGFVAMTDRAHMPTLSVPNLICYEELIGAQDSDYEWPVFDENTASSLCYTSGTTGNPKGVLFSHRSTVLHSYAACTADCLGISAAGIAAAGGADVPRQRLGHALCGSHGRRQAGDAGSGTGRQERLRVAARREGDDGARRADGLADAAAIRRVGGLDPRKRTWRCAGWSSAGRRRRAR